MSREAGERSMLKKKLTLADLEYPSEFVARHIGPSINDYDLRRAG